MKKEEAIKKTVNFAKAKLSKDSSGHDWWHTYRVWQLAKHICSKEGGDRFVIEISALLHDVADWKFIKEENDKKVISDWLNRISVKESEVNAIIDIIKNVSFKGAGVNTKPRTLEGKIVQDADRLDAIGALGISRNFAYSGARGRLMHDPHAKPMLHRSFNLYKKNKSTAINHFYEKSLLLKDLMNTRTGKKMAAGRHKFMEKFLERFFKEWKGEV